MISVIKDKLGGNFVELSAKSYSYLIEYGSENKKAKSTKKCTKRKKLKLENYKKCPTILSKEFKKKFGGENHNDFTEKIKNIKYIISKIKYSV